MSPEASLGGRPALLDLQRRWGSLRGPRIETPSWQLVELRETPGPRLGLWPERVVLVPPDLAGARLAFQAVGGLQPVARVLGGPDQRDRWAALEGERLLAPPSEGPLWVQLFQGAFRFPAPGASDYELGPPGLAGRVLREPHSFEALVLNGGKRPAPIQVTTRSGWLDLDVSEASVPPGEALALRGRIRPGERPLPGEQAVVEVRSGKRAVGELVVEVGAWAPSVGLQVRCGPADLGVLGTRPVPLEVHLQASAAVRVLIQVGLLPHPVAREVQLEPGVLRIETFEIAPEALPRVERGRLRLLALTDAPRSDERTRVAYVTFQRLKLRRDVPRLRLVPSRTDPHPHQRVCLRRSDGGPLRLAWTLSEGLERVLELQSDGEGRLLAWCREPPAEAVEGEIRVRDGETGLEEILPVRVEGRSSR